MKEDDGGRRGENLAGGKSCYSKEEEEEEDARYDKKKGVTKKIMRGAIKLIRGSEANEVEGWQRKGGDKGQQVFLFICCSISVIDLVFSNQPLDYLSLTHTHSHAHAHTQTAS